MDHETTRAILWFVLVIFSCGLVATVIVVAAIMMSSLHSRWEERRRKNGD